MHRRLNYLKKLIKNILDPFKIVMTGLVILFIATLAALIPWNTVGETISAISEAYGSYKPIVSLSIIVVIVGLLIATTRIVREALMEKDYVIVSAGGSIADLVSKLFGNRLRRARYVILRPSSSVQEKFIEKKTRSGIEVRIPEGANTVDNAITILDVAKIHEKLGKLLKKIIDETPYKRPEDVWLINVVTEGSTGSTTATKVHEIAMEYGVNEVAILLLNPSNKLHRELQRSLENEVE